MTGQWFGNLLDWRWDPAQQMHGAWHNGRMHWIAKVSRRTAAVDALKRLVTSGK